MPDTSQHTLQDSAPTQQSSAKRPVKLLPVAQQKSNFPQVRNLREVALWPSL